MATMVALTAPAGLATAADKIVLAPLAVPSTESTPSAWRVVGVPGGKIPLTSFAMTELEGLRVLRVEATKSYGNLVHNLPLPTPGLGTRLSWRWRLDEGLPLADLSVKQGDDSPLKVCALFELPLDKLGLIERNLLRIARAASAEKLPSATLCCVWDSKLKADTLLPNAYTNRVRLIVVSGSEHPLRQWSSHSRDLEVDFRRAFGAESESLPPLLAILVGGDADNTSGRSLGYVSELRLNN
jgi:hypothetical protein